MGFASHYDGQMADELDLDLDELNNEDISREQSRNKRLSEKVKETSKERDEARAEAERIKAEKEALAKEAEFYKGFAKTSSKYPGASDYQDKIWDKVKTGYSLDDATISTLVAEGKYTPPAQPEVKETAAGGSAATSISDPSEKSLKDMSTEEKRKELEKLSYGEIFGS